jgi:lipopolysaccharide transport system ATP-binding protein
LESSTVIKVDNVWKRYGLPLIPFLRQSIQRLFGHSVNIENYGPWALKNVSLELKRGEMIGIIGNNGAGKSTLLKLLAGVSPVTHGHVAISGTIFPMIELAAGLNPELTGKQNVYMLGTVMGLTYSEITKRLGAIEEFCELGDWFHRPVRKYSSGMLARLGFAVAVNIDADILLIDEVLSVGDISFQRKCFDYMERVRKDRRNSIVFVSHSIRQVERLCERTLLLDKGEGVAFGKTSDIISLYYERSYDNINYHYIDGENKIIGRQFENPIINIVSICLKDVNTMEQTRFETGESIVIEISYQTPHLCKDVNVGISIATVDSFYVAGFSNEKSGLFDLEGNGKFTCTIANLPLLTGIYMLNLKLQDSWGNVLGGGYSLQSFSVVVDPENRLSSDYGIIQIIPQWGEPTSNLSQNYHSSEAQFGTD